MVRAIDDGCALRATCVHPQEIREDPYPNGQEQEDDNQSHDTHEYPNHLVPDARGILVLLKGHGLSVRPQALYPVQPVSAAKSPASGVAIGDRARLRSQFTFVSMWRGALVGPKVVLHAALR